MRKRCCFILFSGLAVLSAAGSHALHPLTTENTAFLGKGNRQAETWFEHTIAQDPAEFYGNNFGAVLSYGLTAKCDILFSAPWQGWTSGGTSEGGPGDLALEGKFQVAERGGWAFALKPGFSLPTGDADKGLGSGKSNLSLRAIVGTTAGPWHYYLNAGYAGNRNSGGEREDILSASAAAAAAFAATEKLLLAADLAVETSAEPGGGAFTRFQRFSPPSGLPALRSAWTLA